MKDKSRQCNFSFLLSSAILLLAACLSVLLPIGVHAMSRQSLSTPEQAEAFVSLLLGEDSASLDGIYDLTPEMEKAVTASGGWAGLAKSLAVLGKPDRIGSAYEDTWRGMNVLRVPCTFSAAPADLVFVLENGAIAGLVTDVYTGESETPTEETENIGSKDETESAGNADAAEAQLFTEVSLSVPVPELNGELPGTLTIPEGDGPFPAVILVHGSGPASRDEEVVNLRPFRDLAEGLAKKGIAVFRYDKRTYVYGREMAEDVQDTLMEETVKDAAKAALIVSGQEKIDPSRIFILGHSLGATAVPVIHEQLRTENLTAAGFIMMAPAARPLDELMREQYNYLYSLIAEPTDAQLNEKAKLLEELDRLENLDDLPDETAIAGAYVPYWRWLLSYDVLAEAEKITESCLVLQGEEDYQVTMEDFLMWQQAFGDHPGWKFISYPGLVHTFTKGEKSEGAAVYGRNEHVDEQVISDIAQFVADEEN